MKVRFTSSARAQFLSAIAYILRNKPSAATRFRDRAETVLRRLEDSPESGRVIPEFPELPYQEVIISPYRFFYKTKGDIVWIVAVWHGAQLPEKPEPWPDPGIVETLRPYGVPLTTLTK